MTLSDVILWYRLGCNNVTIYFWTIYSLHSSCMFAQKCRNSTGSLDKPMEVKAKQTGVARVMGDIEPLLPHLQIQIQHRQVQIAMLGMIVLIA